MKAFTTHTTITGRKIKTVANNSKRTFTIVTDAARYRTYPMSQEEFNSCLMNTGNDWRDFLRADEYYKVK